MKFSRKSNYLGKTWAFIVFSKHHTEINNMYWSFVPAWSFAHYIARKNKSETPERLFHARGPDVHRLDNSIPRFIHNFEELANWVRLSALLSTLSYFEAYVKKAVTLSLMSDPAIRFGKPGAIDGISWIKSDMRDDTDSVVTPCVMGDWGSRINAYKRLFSSVPASLEKARKVLDSYRVLRNKVGHNFGRSLEVKLQETGAASMARFSENNLKICLDLVFNIAKDIDEHLLAGHIGCFEEALYFHNWRRTLRGIQRLDEGKHLRKALAHEHGGRTPGTRYCVELVAHYHDS